MKYAKIENEKVVYSQESIDVENMGEDFEVNKNNMKKQGYKPVHELADKYKYRDCEGEYSFELVDKGEYLEEVAVFHPYPAEKMNEIIKKRRQTAYSQNTDPLICRKIRKEYLGQWTEADEAEFIETIKKMSYDIDTGNPYVDNSAKIKQDTTKEK